MSNRIRASFGSAVELGLVEGKLAARPSTAYLLLGSGACRGKCAFCAQSTYGLQGQIARVSWPQYPLDSVFEALRSSGSIERVCFQCPDDDEAKMDLPFLVARASIHHPVSVSMPPWDRDFMTELKVAGAERLTVPMDCASPRLFTEMKGKRMSECLNSLSDAVDVFGRGRVGTHLIVGLGEAEREVVGLVGRLLSRGIMPSLFALTPVKGTAMEKRKPPPLAAYRRLQLALHIMADLGVKVEGFSFDRCGEIIGYPMEKTAMEEIVRGGKPFETKGCPGCNRPYFNERVSGPIYNFPYPPSPEEIRSIEEAIYGNA
jgi:biotin synthase